MHAFDTPTGIPYGQINLQTQQARNPTWTQKASILSELGTEQLELIQTSLMTGNPVYAQKTEAVIRFLNQQFPDKVSSSPPPSLVDLLACHEFHRG
jgi:mannosyl-oligosaccharide alpha-1,2-mannosidase